MKYTLVRPDGTLGDTRDFTEAPPSLAPNKGKWLPDNPPEFNPATHTRTRGTQSVNASAVVYLVAPRPQSDIDAEVTAAALAELAAIDQASIRAMREWIAAQPTAPQILKDREAAAQAARLRIK